VDITALETSLVGTSSSWCARTSICAAPAETPSHLITMDCTRTCTSTRMAVREMIDLLVSRRA